MLFAPFLSILENALMAIIFQRENVVIEFGSLKEQIMSSHLLIKCDVIAYNKTLQQQNPVKGSVNFISALP
jgi:hypothetical protein